MPKSSPLSLRATVTKRTQPEPVAPDLAEWLEQLKHHHAAEGTSVESDPINPPVDPPQMEKPPKSPQGYDPHALQVTFLTANLNRVVTVFILNGVKLVGKLRQYDQFTLLLEGPDGVSSLIFKHAISTIAPASQ